VVQQTLPDANEPKGEHKLHERVWTTRGIKNNITLLLQEQDKSTPVGRAQGGNLLSNTFLSPIEWKWV
jgi:hypothetical protein